MKKYIKLLFLILTLSFFTACDKDDELVVFDSENGQVALSFATTSVLSVTVQPDGSSITIPVNVTTKSDSDRSFTVSTDAASTALTGSFTLGNVTIPAGSFNGSVDVTFDSALLEDGVLYTLILNIDAPTDGTTFNKATINYNKKVICNDMKLSVTTDFWAEETSWEITDASGTVVESFPGGWSNGVADYEFTFTLPDGAYTLTFFDVYSDGMFDGTNTGSYTLTCSILTHVTGGGAFGASQSTDFVVNP